jgi:hypothetical protein
MVLLPLNTLNGIYMTLFWNLTKFGENRLFEEECCLSYSEDGAMYSIKILVQTYGAAHFLMH